MVKVVPEHASSVVVRCIIARVIGDLVRPCPRRRLFMARIAINGSTAEKDAPGPNVGSGSRRST